MLHEIAGFNMHVNGNMIALLYQWDGCALKWDDEVFDRHVLKCQVIRTDVMTYSNYLFKFDGMNLFAFISLATSTVCFCLILLHDIIYLLLSYFSIVPYNLQFSAMMLMLCWEIRHRDRLTVVDAITRLAAAGRCKGKFYWWLHNFAFFFFARISH
jgi:hypothetical protein